MTIKRIGRRFVDLSRLEVPAMSQNAPGDARQLVGERNCQHVAVQSLLGGFDPGLEAMALPALGLDQHDPCRLHEQDTQVAIAAFRYLAEDGAVTGRDLLRDEPEPSSKVAAFGEHISSADRGHHRAGDDRADARHAHQPLATGILARNSLDLAR